MSSQRVVRFGKFEFDFASGELRSSGRKVALQSQPAQVLSYLLNNPQQVVSREELRRAIWADDTFVDFDTALNVAINKVRQALSDSASSPRFVETIPRRGYRFVADVHAVPSSDAVEPVVVTPPAASAASSGRWRWIAAFCLVAAAAAAPALWSALREPSPAGPRSLAVLPFRSLIAETRDDALEVGLTEAVIVRLGQLKQLRVPSINAVQRYTRSEQDPLEAGRELGVDAVLDGTLMGMNGNLRLSARLLDVKKGTTIWGQQWDFPWTDIFTVQDSMATEVTRALALSLATEEHASLRRHPTNVAAYESFLRARYLLLRRTVEDSRRAAQLLEEAVRLDPGSAAAHASLAFAYISIPLLEGPSDPFVELGRRAALRALELDATIAEAHAVIGRILVHFDWDADASGRAARKALELDPNNPFVLHCYSLMLADQGRFDEALTLADRALALDPSSILANRDKAIILYIARRYGECIEQCQRTLELDRYNAAASVYLAQAYEHMGRPLEAIEAYLTPLNFSERNRDMVAALRAAGERGGLKEFWSLRLQYLLKEPRPRTAAVAGAYVRIGEHDRAMEWLERLYGERGARIVNLKVHPVWDPLRDDPRFKRLLERARLAQPPTSVLSRQRPSR